jgi:hypothetical protein
VKSTRFLFRVLAGFALVGVVSCAVPTDPSVEAADHQASLNLGGIVNGVVDGLLACTPMPQASASKVIGRDGGTIQVGPHTLYFPPGALSAPTLIRAVAPSDRVNSVVLEPHGIQFTGPRPHLTLSYSNCGVVQRLLPHKIAYTTDLLGILDILNSVDNLFKKEVSAPLDHFSRYAVAW